MPEKGLQYRAGDVWWWMRSSGDVEGPCGADMENEQMECFERVVYSTGSGNAGRDRRCLRYRLVCTMAGAKCGRAKRELSVSRTAWRQWAQGGGCWKGGSGVSDPATEIHRRTCVEQREEAVM